MSLIVLVIAVSLSMDAFSLSLAYGTLNLSKYNIYKISIIVGLFHFIMPCFGMYLGDKVMSVIPINSNVAVFIILVIIGINMCIDTFKETIKKELSSIFSFLCFGLAVSLDSFSVGVGMEAISNNLLLCALSFSLSSYLFTYIGLMLGKKINEIIGKTSTFIGGMALIGIGVFYLVC